MDSLYSAGLGGWGTFTISSRVDSFHMLSVWNNCLSTFTPPKITQMQGKYTIHGAFDILVVAQACSLSLTSSLADWNAPTYLYIHLRPRTQQLQRWCPTGLKPLSKRLVCTFIIRMCLEICVNKITTNSPGLFVTTLLAKMARIQYTVLPTFRHPYLSVLYRMADWKGRFSQDSSAR
jgi:hypothetical protein